MGAIASQITSLTIVYSTVYSDADQRKRCGTAEQQNYCCVLDNTSFPSHEDDLVSLRVMIATQVMIMWMVN